MKKPFKLFGITILLALIGFSILACDDGLGGGRGEGGSSTQVPSAPTGVTAQRNPSALTTVNISWNAVGGATSYNVYYTNSSNSSGTLEGSSTTTSYTSTSKNIAAIWLFRVTAVNSAGEGSPSSWVTVGPTSASGTPPSEPTDVTATVTSSSSITVSWSSVYEANGYHVYRSSSALGTYIQSATVTTTSYTQTTGLSAGTTYYFKVAAYNHSGTGPQSSYVYATIP